MSAQFNVRLYNSQLKKYDKIAAEIYRVPVKYARQFEHCVTAMRVAMSLMRDDENLFLQVIDSHKISTSFMAWCMQATGMELRKLFEKFMRECLTGMGDAERRAWLDEMTA